MRNLPSLLAGVFYLFAPLIAASALSGLVLRFDLFRRLRLPIDAGLTLRGQRLFGDNKTWRGVAVAVVGCIAMVAVQKYLLAERLQAFALLDYRSVGVVSFGTALGAGATFGELPNSFVKRQLGIQPGNTTGGRLRLLFYLWDQVDLLSSWVLIAFWVRPTVPLLGASVVIALVLHPTVSLIGYAVGARSSAR